MMILRSAAPSPFGRKVAIALSVLGFEDVTIEPTDTMDPDAVLREENPLGKIPVLITDTDGIFYDSRVILEYLDARAGGGKIIPREMPARFSALRLQALCDGILDASILTVYEGRWRPSEKHEAKWLDHQAGKVERALAVLESEPPRLGPNPDVPNVGQIALACALGYRDLRFDGAWRRTYPRLVAWLAEFSAHVPAYEATAMKS
jgi:glutathione S-transferase